MEPQILYVCCPSFSREVSRAKVSRLAFSPQVDGGGDLLQREIQARAKFGAKRTRVGLSFCGGFQLLLRVPFSGRKSQLRQFFG